MKQFLGNSRLIFLKQDNDKIDISKALGVIDSKIIDSKNLNFTSSEIILEFFENPTRSDFLGQSMNIGRLITGFEQQVFDELTYKDYTTQEAKTVELPFVESWNEFFEKARQILPESADKWTVRVSEDFSKMLISFLA